MATRFRVYKVDPITREPLKPGIYMNYVTLPDAEAFVKSSPRVWAVDPLPRAVKVTSTVPLPIVRVDEGVQPAVQGQRMLQEVRQARKVSAHEEDALAGVRKLMEAMGNGGE
jgi:hypothetical protein